MIKALLGVGGFGWVALSIFLFGSGVGGYGMRIWMSADFARLQVKLAEESSNTASLVGNISSCNVALEEVRRNAVAEKEKNKSREIAINNAYSKALEIAEQSSKQRTETLTKEIRGATECEQIINAIDDHFLGEKNE